MKLSYFTLAVLLLACCPVLRAQPTAPVEKKISQNQLGLSLGLDKGYLKDLNFSSLQFTETGPLFSLYYNGTARNGRSIVMTGANFSKGSLKTTSSDFFSSDFFSGSISFSYLRKLTVSKNSKLVLFLGPQYRSLFQYIQWGEQESWTYLMTHGLCVKALGAYKISGRKRIQTTVSLPFFQVLVRPPYNGFDQYIVQNQEKILKIAFKGEPASFKKYKALDWETVYYYAASSHLDFSLGYLFRYQGVPGYNKVRHYQSGLTAGFAIKF